MRLTISCSLEVVVTVLSFRYFVPLPELIQTFKLKLFADANFLLGCVRDDTIKVLDLRMNQIICSFR
jgi:hypothetical protein